MTFNELFTAYYTQFRADSDVPDSTSDEYTVGMRMANEAINRWANYDGTYWKELFKEASLNSVAGTETYAAPADMREVGGFVRLGSSRVPVIEPSEAQFRSDNGNYAYFTGNHDIGYTLNFNKEMDVTGTGNITFVYYKNPSLFVTGTDEPEMADPYFIVHRMLANQFRAARNPYYSSAKADAENALRQMQLDNNSGSWNNPWTMPDNSGTVWGQSVGGGYFN